MRKHFWLTSVVAGFVVMVLSLSQVAVFAGGVGQDPAATSEANQKDTSHSRKAAKKRKKKSRKPSVSSVPFLSLPSIAQPVAGSADVSQAPAAGVAPVNTTTKGTSRAAKIPGIRVSPQLNLVPAVSSVSLTNATAISIAADVNPNPEALSPYPSNITVAGLTGTVNSVSVTINNFSHTFPDDIDMLLVSPDGRAFHFWSDVGGAIAASNVTVTVADAGGSSLPESGPLVNGTTYKPFNSSTVGDTFPAPAPAGPYSEPATIGAATFASVFNGMTPAQANGIWSLYVTDDLDGDFGSLAGGWTLDITTTAPPTTAGQLIISEFRLRGPNGANDEYIELYNTTGAALTAQAADASGGLGVAASDGVTRCTVPNGTVIPAGGHFLCVNSVGYSQGGYPAGNGTTATGDATYVTDMPDNAGIALFNNSTGGASYSLANRLDAVGSTSEANTTYKEGTGYPALTPFSIDYAFYRDTCGKSGSITTFGQCSISTPKDTNNNAADFIFVDSNGTSAGAGQRLGAAGPENLSSPLNRNSTITAALLDPCAAASSPPNRVRDFTSAPAQNSTFGTLDIRRTFTNNTGGNVTRLRYRVIDLTTFPAPSGIADLRPRTASDVVVTVDRAPCGSGTSNITVFGTTLEQGGIGQPNGGGFNSSLSSGTVTLGTPLANGATIDIRWLLGIQQTGSFKFYVNIEALP